ncbi:hypothetical protein LguiA_011017 [Lonicera macranthoides]
MVQKKSGVSEIPKDGSLVEIGESLDLSRNRFSGSLPTSLVGLNYLSALDLSYNRFLERTLLSTQVQSFDPSMYRGNGGLCGPRLTQSITSDAQSFNRKGDSLEKVLFHKFNVSRREEAAT